MEVGVISFTDRRCVPVYEENPSYLIQTPLFFFVCAREKKLQVPGFIALDIDFPVWALANVCRLAILQENFEHSSSVIYNSHTHTQSFLKCPLYQCLNFSSGTISRKVRESVKVGYKSGSSARAVRQLRCEQMSMSSLGGSQKSLRIKYTKLLLYFYK